MRFLNVDVNIPGESNSNDSKVLENIKDNKCKTRLGNKEYLMSHTNIKLNNKTKCFKFSTWDTSIGHNIVLKGSLVRKSDSV